jgi:hypothetical protein
MYSAEPHLRSPPLEKLADFPLYARFFLSATAFPTSPYCLFWQNEYNQEGKNVGVNSWPAEAQLVNDV